MISYLYKRFFDMANHYKKPETILVVPVSTEEKEETKKIETTKIETTKIETK